MKPITVKIFRGDLEQLRQGNYDRRPIIVPKETEGARWITITIEQKRERSRPVGWGT